VISQIAQSPRTNEADSAASLSPEVSADGSQDLSATQLGELMDEATQTEYRRQYLLQLDRRRIPGCGE
jgi:hypothetical protein